MFISTFRPTFINTFWPPQDSPILSAPLAKPLKADLFEISIVAYDLICKQKDYTTFITTLDEISSLISNWITPKPSALIPAPKLSASI